MTPELKYITGFSDRALSQEHVVALHDVCIRGAVDRLYVYTNIIREQCVGDSLVPLLRVCAVRGSYGENVQETFMRPHFCGLLQKEISEISVEVRTASGALVPFSFGSTVIVLQFRKKLEI